MIRKTTSIFIILVMITSFTMTAFGADYEYVSTNLYSEPIIFDVTVPTSIPVYVDAYGGGF